MSVATRLLIYECLPDGREVYAVPRPGEPHLRQVCVTSMLKTERRDRGPPEVEHVDEAPIDRKQWSTGAYGFWAMAIIDLANAGNRPTRIKVTC